MLHISVMRILYSVYAPRGYGPQEVGGNAKEDGAHDDPGQANHEYRFPSDRVRSVPPNVAAQEPAEREGARNVARIVTCCVGDMSEFQC